MITGCGTVDLQELVCSYILHHLGSCLGWEGEGNLLDGFGLSPKFLESTYRQALRAGASQGQER